MKAIVGGYTPGDGGRTGTFGSLLMGLLDGATLRWVGAVGSGFDDAELGAVRAALDQMSTADRPFAAGAELPRGSRWVEPHLVAIVEYKEWTDAGRLRAPVFLGFTDTPRDTVTWASEGPAGEVGERRRDGAQGDRDSRTSQPPLP